MPPLLYLDNCTPPFPFPLLLPFPAKRKVIKPTNWAPGPKPENPTQASERI